ncbi:MAG: CoA ester lyase [Acetobacteraceae bacterium]|nr:CoA ester lyase [Acetobacteraceae bacterium]
MSGLRSFLFVPADSERKLARAAEAEADVLLLDLEDSVGAERKKAARAMAADWLRSAARPSAFVRVNAFDTGLTFLDLAAVMPARPDGIMLPKCAGAADVARLAAALDALEAREAIAPGGTRIMPIATETAGALFTLGQYAGASPRLVALTWGAEDLAAVVGARANKHRGRFDDLFRLARALCLAGAAAADVAAIDTVYPDFRDGTGFARECADARRMGFTGKMAIHPGQVSAINDAFTPSVEEREHAQAIVDAFAASPGAGVVSLHGRMVDRPHLIAARRLLGLS